MHSLKIPYFNFLFFDRRNKYSQGTIENSIATCKFLIREFTYIVWYYIHAYIILYNMSGLHSLFLHVDVYM